MGTNEPRSPKGPRARATSRRNKRCAARQAGLVGTEFETRKAFLEFGERDARLLAELAAELGAARARFVDRFYAHLLRFEETSALIADPATLERLKASQASYFERLFAGDYGPDYGEDRARVGVAHYRIGLKPKWYIGAYALYLRLLLPEVWRATGGEWSRALPALEAIHKVVFLDMGIAIDTYRAADRRHILDLKRQNERIVESVPAGLLVVDSDLKLVAVNRSFVESCGCARADLLGRPVTEVLGAAEVESALREALASGTSRSGLLFTARCPASGATRPVRMTVTGIELAEEEEEEEEEEARLLLVIEDLSAERRAEDALRQSEAHLRTLVDHAVFGIYRSTRDGRLLMVNRALVEMLGYDSAEELLAVSMPTALYQQPEERSRLLELHAARDYFRGVEVGWKRKDGTPISVRLSGRPVPAADGELTTLEVFVEDITERLALEDQLRQSQKMQAVGELAGGIAHDFNNLLTTILANSELMAGELPPDSALAEEVASIRQAALRGAELTGKVLGFSRRRHLELQAVDLGAVVTDFGRMMRRVLSEDIRMRVIVEEAKLVARADPGAVDQVLMNLVTNARDAMPPGGTLLVQARRAVLDEAYCEVRGWGKAGEYVAIEVSDTGVGMDEQTRRRIFEPFFTTKPAGAGTGLGMAMVYGLVKQHGGYVDVYTEVGRGTTVRVFLPASAEASERPAAAAPPQLWGGTETILLVEDEEALRRTTKRVLERHGYTVLTAADGAEALDAFQAHRAEIALVISDVVMPRMGGPELLQRLQGAGHRVRFLFTSGYTAPDVEATAKIPSGAPFVSKPWNIADLLSRVRRVLDVPL